MQGNTIGCYRNANSMLSFCKQVIESSNPVIRYGINSVRVEAYDE